MNDGVETASGAQDVMRHSKRLRSSDRFITCKRLDRGHLIFCVGARSLTVHIAVAVAVAVAVPLPLPLLPLPLPLPLPWSWACCVGIWAA